MTGRSEGPPAEEGEAGRLPSDPVTTATPAPTHEHEAPSRVLRRRLTIGYLALFATWATVFNLPSLPFFPTVVVGGVLTGVVGLWARRACPADTLPGLRVTPRQALLAVGVAVAHFALGHLLFNVGDALWPAIGDSAQRIYERTNETPLLPRLVLSGLLTAPLEELFWRGAFHPTVREAAWRRLPQLPRPLVAIAVSAAGYTLFHVGTLKPSLIAAAALGGLVWAWLLEHTRSLGAAVIAHALWTSLMVLVPVV